MPRVQGLSPLFSVATATYGRRMCDYCDCRTHGAIASLARDHDALIGLLDRVERYAAVGDRVSSAPALAELADLLDRHARREEDGVFAEIVRADAKHACIGQFLDDHDWIHELLLLSTGPTPDSVWQAAVKELVKRLTDHIQREESDLFPAAHQLLTPPQWDAVDGVHAHVNTRTTGAPA